MEDDVGQDGGAVKEADMNIRDAEQAGGDSIPPSVHAFLPAACLPDAHQHLGTFGRGVHDAFTTGAVCVLAQIEASAGSTSCVASSACEHRHLILMRR